MKTEESNNERHFNISSRKELAAALRSPDASIRASLLQTINKQVDHAAATGKHINQEIIDELYLIYTEQQENLERAWYSFLLLRLNCTHSLEIARKEFVSSENNNILVLAATHLAKLPVEERVELLGPLVMDSSNPARCRAAANLLDDCMVYLEPAIALRAAVISDHDMPLPPVNIETIDAWIYELKGPYPQSTRNNLIKLGTEAITDLMSLWDHLPDDIRIWALNQGVEKKIPGIEIKIRESIRQDTGRDLILCALECFKTLQIEDEDILAPLYKHEDSSVQASAISAGSVAIDCSCVMSTETPVDVRLAMITRMGKYGGDKEIELLTRLLEDGNWRVRAKAVDSLVALAPASMESLKASLGSEIENVRVAAAQGLHRLGKEEWVMDILSQDSSVGHLR